MIRSAIDNLTEGFRLLHEKHVAKRSSVCMIL